MNAEAAESLPTQANAFLSREHRLLIDGAWESPVNGGTLDVVNPATGRRFATVAAGDGADIERAVAAARRAFDGRAWSAMPPGERARLLWALADLIEADGQQIATLESLDNGMPFGFAMGAAVAGSAGCLRYNAGWAGKLNGETMTLAAPDHHAYVLREPVGVVGAIVPWNFPLTMAVSKLAPALAAGCTVVLKPAEQTTLTALRLGELILEAGFPPGVINIVPGYGETAGRALVEHPDVDRISFTGSTAVGKDIVARAAGNLKRVSLELGGKSPVIVLPDADLEAAIPGAAMGVFMNAGQVCVAGSRLFVHRRVFDRVVEGVSRVAENLKVGAGLDPDTQMGPLVSEEQLERVAGYIRSGVDEGGELVVGGKRLGEHGYFMQPTVFAQTGREMRLVREEIFGPVVCAMPIDDDDLERIAQQANDTTYGLSASVWTRDISVAHKLARRIRAGTVRINGGAGIDQALPFGGYKQSGWGRENGRYGVESYTELKSVSVAL